MIDSSQNRSLTKHSRSALLRQRVFIDNLHAVLRRIGESKAFIEMRTSIIRWFEFS